ncbi:MAG: hypothetical protein OXC10_19900 [Rhodospirillaceae bacterium]|nr:hypothetical protein [Rhodospirillaceae bacterium]
MSTVVSMKQLTKMVPAVAALALLTASIGLDPAQASECENPDNITYVQGSDHCLAIQTYWAAGNPDTLAIYIHGDVPSGRPVDFVFGIGRFIARRGANAVILIRPGFRGAGRSSSGMPTHSLYSFERHRLYVMESMGAAIARLKAHHKAKRLILIGTSGGALIAGVLLGLKADVVDAALLISCPCDLQSLIHEKGPWSLPQAESPHNWLPKASAKARIIAISGSADTNTVPHFVDAYIKSAQARGLEAEFVIVPGGGHGGQLFVPYIVTAINKLLRR